MRHTDAIIIGAGQAGLAMSHCLSRSGIDHVVLERGRLAERWHSERWDSLRLLTPNWMSRLPGWSYQGADPDGFMTQQAYASYREQYATAASAPVVTVPVHPCGRRRVATASKASGACGMRRAWRSPPGTATYR
jgi:putative flavoprotein involved in K+ transport